MKIKISKEGRPLRLSAVYSENGKYFIKYVYLDTMEYKTIPYSDEVMLKFC